MARRGAGLAARGAHPSLPAPVPVLLNPLALDKAGAELDTATWLRVIDEAGALGVLQVPFSGGEPTLRRDLEVMSGAPWSSACTPT